MIVKQEQTGKLSFLGVSEIGEFHVKNGKPNQDAIDFFAFGNVFCVAVSDGLGSCERSQIGSQMATLICKLILLEIADARLCFECNNIVMRFAELWTEFFDTSVAKNYSATLKAVFGKDNWLIAISVGDGLLSIFSYEETLTAPNAANDFINETICLSHGMNPAAYWTKKITKRDDGIIFISTDGVSNGILEKHESEFVREIAKIKEFSELRQSIESILTEMSKYNSDDKTLGIVLL
ncbi:MAG: protein phosphatase 2C domain-containing protein [Deferribacteraceae bacterium]|jgi:serine/threonine protein phosphatase PrpC|nr:protein phosphatase 2C domain-containing protein [Deferribacteraceae bacterium]